MKKHKYCCQNKAQDYLDHMIDVPDDFSIDVNKLNSLGKEEFITGFKKLTEIVKDLYRNMISDHEGFGLPMVEDLEYHPFNPKAAESKNSAHRLVMLLYILANSGELKEDRLIINKKDFQDICKAQKTVFKISNYSMIFNKFIDFGFEIENFNGKTINKNTDDFTVSYPNYKNVITALYGYMKGIKFQRDIFISLHYYLLTPLDNLPTNHIQNVFSQYLQGNEKTFYIELMNFLSEMDFHCMNNFGYSFALQYLINPKDKQYIVRCFSEYGRLSVYFKLNFIDNYSPYLETLPENIKQIFRKSNCHLCQGEEPCHYRKSWTFEGINYIGCSHFTHNITDFNLEYMDYYKEIIKSEAQAKSETKKKKK